MKMRKVLKKMCVTGLACCMLLSCVKVSGKSLEASFSGDSTYKSVDYKVTTKMYTYEKTTYAKTEGYKGEHYVRAYIGGSSSSSSGSLIDSGRKWSSGDVKASVSTKALIPETDVWLYQLYFPTGYSKYGK